VNANFSKPQLFGMNDTTAVEKTITAVVTTTFTLN